VKVQYNIQDPAVNDTDASLSKDKPTLKEGGKLDEAFADKDSVAHTGTYGIPVITHCCLEPHGQVTEVKDDELYVWPSTQNVSRYTDRLGDSVGIPQNKIHVDCQHMGGGFGSKFELR
jgi:xanthine dehydrogenase YagR molybdenum-binding subunit